MLCLLVQEGGGVHGSGASHGSTVFHGAAAFHESAASHLRFPVRMLTTPWQRIRGLLGTQQEASAVLLMPCHAVHTYGMSYPIDIAFLSGDMYVLSSIRCLPKNSSVSCSGAACVVERPAQSQAWLEVGKHVRIEESHIEESSYESHT